MAANKYLALVGGKKKSVQANDASAGAGDAGKLVALGADGFIHPSMIAGLEVAVRTTSESLAARDCVSLHDSSGVKVRKATNAAYSTRGCGFVKAAYTSSPEPADVYFEGIIGGFTGLTIDADYYLGTGGGIILEGALPTASGTIVQKVGRAISDTEIIIEIEEPIEL